MSSGGAVGNVTFGYACAVAAACISGVSVFVNSLGVRAFAAVTLVAVAAIITVGLRRDRVTASG